MCILRYRTLLRNKKRARSYSLPYYHQRLRSLKFTLLELDLCRSTPRNRPCLCLQTQRSRAGPNLNPLLVLMFTPHSDITNTDLEARAPLGPSRPQRTSLLDRSAVMFGSTGVQLRPYVQLEQQPGVRSPAASVLADEEVLLLRNVCRSTRFHPATPSPRYFSDKPVTLKKACA